MSRRRRSPDVSRIGMAVSQPGIDPRSWVTTGRVDDDPEAIRWELGIGWVVDVTMTGGPLDGTGPVPCRVAEFGRGQDSGRFSPVKPGQEVAVLIVGGSPEVGPIVVGTLSNRGGSEAPVTVAGLPIAYEAPVSVPLESVSPYDTEIEKSSTPNLVTERAGQELRQAAKHILESSGPASTLLGSRSATEPFVKGLSYTQAELQMLTALAVAFDSLATASAPPAPWAALAAGFQAAATAIRLMKPPEHLSTKILGE